MGNAFKFILNRAGVRELLKSSEMAGVISGYADRKAQQAGEGYASDVHAGRNRVYANIYPDTKEARRDNLKNNTLEKVIRS